METRANNCVDFEPAAGPHAEGPIYQLSPRVRSASDSGGGVILDIHCGQMFSLNAVGARIVELLKEGLHESTIVEQVSTDFGVNLAIAASDTREFFEALKRCGVIEQRSVEGAGPQ